MSLSSLPLVTDALRLVRDLVTDLSTHLVPVVGSGSATAVAVVLLTLVVRALLVPLGIAQVRADLTRRRLAPQVADLRRRHRDRPEVLQRRLAELYRAEGTSPAAGCLPLLLQAPVLALVYGVFAHRGPAATADQLLDHALAGIPLGSSPLHSLLASAGDPVTLLVVAGVLTAVAVAGLLLARTMPLEPGAPALARRLRWAGPVLSTGFAAIAPLAAGLYLATSATWTCTERRVVRRVLVRRALPGGTMDR